MFHVYRCASPDGCRGSPFRLGTWSRNELLLLSILGPFSLTDMRADFDPVVYAADASPYGLGVVAAEVGKPVVAELWRRADVQGRTRHLLHALSASLREIGQGNWDDLLAEEDLGEDEFLGRNDAGGRIYNDEGVKANCNSVLLSCPADGTRFAFGADPCYNMIDRKATNEMKGPPLDKFPVCFEVIEVCGGIGGIGDAALKRGCRTLNMELKLGWDVLDDGVLRWLIWMCISGRCFFLMLEPPCTTMSLARKPGLRSSRVPWGFDVYCKKTAEGSYFGAICLMLGTLQWMSGNYFCLEQPLGGFMKWFPAWLILLSLGAFEDRSPQCRWLRTKEKYRKETIFLHNHPGLGCLTGCCTCTKPHIQLCGSLTTRASAYPEALSEDVITGIADSLPAEPGPWGLAKELVVDNNGIGELYNGVCAEDHTVVAGTAKRAARKPGSKTYIISLSECLRWRVVRKCRPRRQAHINLHEQRAWRLVLKCAKRGSRVFGLQDSRVNLGAGAKGRSPSQSLNRLLCRSGSITWGRGLYPRSDHVPTWSIRADEPSRDYVLRPPRGPVPPWLRRLSAGDRPAGSLLLDSLSSASKAENRWMQFVVAVGALHHLGLHDCRVELGGGGGAEGSDAAGGGPSAARRCHLEEGDGQPALCSGALRGMARHGRRGPSGVDGAHEPRGPLRMVGRVYIPVIRDAVGALRGSVAPQRGRRHVPLDAGAFIGAMVDPAELGKVRARFPPDANALGLAQGPDGGRAELGLAPAGIGLVDSLFRLTAAHRTVWIEATRRAAASGAPDGGLPSSTSSRAQERVGPGLPAIREGRRPGGVPLARGRDGEVGSGGVYLARISRDVCAQVGAFVRSDTWRQAFGSSFVAPYGRSNTLLYEVERRLAAVAMEG